MTPEPSTEQCIVPIGETSSLNLALVGLPRGRENHPIDYDNPLLRGDIVQNLNTLREVQTELQSIRDLIILHFDRLNGRQAEIRLYLVGSSASAELRGEPYKKGRDLDIMIVGITQEMLMSEEFRKALETSFNVKPWTGTVNADWKGLKLTSSGIKFDLFTPYFPSNKNRPETIVAAIQNLANATAAIEILDNGFQFVSAYDDTLQTVSVSNYIELPFVPGLGDVPGYMRYLRELGRTPYFTTTLETLNRIRNWWFSFRRIEHTIEEVRRISNSVNNALTKGFAEADRAGLAERYFTLLVHTGVFHALFPAAWSCSGHRLTGPAGKPEESIIEYLREHGFTLENLGSAMRHFIDTRAALYINGLNIEGLPYNWHTSFLWNCIIESRLMNTDFSTKTLFPAEVSNISVSDLLGPERPNTDSKTIAESARSVFWNVVGVYLESSVLAEAIRLDAIMSLASKIADIRQPTSIFDRIGIIYERVNTQIMSLLARGEFEAYCQEAMTMYRKVLEHVSAKESKFVVVSKSRLFDTFFKMHLLVFLRSPNDPILKIDREIYEEMMRIYRKRIHNIQFVFD